MSEITAKQLFQESKAITDYLSKQTGSHCATQEMLENCNDIITRAKSGYPKETEGIKLFQDAKSKSTRYESVASTMIRLTAILEHLAGTSRYRVTTIE